jgi:hypothetical protein
MFGWQRMKQEDFELLDAYLCRLWETLEEATERRDMDCTCQRASPRLTLSPPFESQVDPATG